MFIPTWIIVVIVIYYFSQRDKLADKIDDLEDKILNPYSSDHNDIYDYPTGESNYVADITTKETENSKKIDVSKVKNELKKVVLIDKDKFILRMYRTELIKENIDVLDFIDYSDDVLAQIIKFRPDVITCEAISSGGILDRFDILRSIRKSGEMIRGKSLSHTRFVFLTNQGQPHDLKQALDMGVDGYIIKAKIAPDELVGLLNKVNKGLKVVVVEDTSKK